MAEPRRAEPCHLQLHILTMDTPTVSFIIPCYKLGHLLSECVQSILGQTYSDLEVLIMDDCSPDNTGEVAMAIRDTRVKYIRNENNLGHLRNYNKGIQLARGKYIWLISADDRLRVHNALERYVKTMDEHPRVGYVFCPGVALTARGETDVLERFYYGASDTIFDGRQFVAEVLRSGGGLLSPSVMVRKECYEQISLFPLDMPHQGDLYLWFLWALDCDVAYVSEPLVNYRLHEASMMKDFLTRSPKTIFVDEANVLWRIKHEAERKGLRDLALYIEPFISAKYAHAVAVAQYNEECVTWGLTSEQCDGELRANSANTTEYTRLRSMFLSSVGDKHWHHGKVGSARQSYRLALQHNWRAGRVWTKLLLTYMGAIGCILREPKMSAAPNWASQFRSAPTD